ncbi:MAG TPA: YegP family protein [Ignavibacteria bacterium]|nr:YegP family protein [Ignavibacteria bacterium]HMQ99197.1 YegP family protein [Ignavibacteria bacterium]
MPTRFEKYSGPDGLHYVKMLDDSGRAILQCTGCPAESNYTNCVNRIRSAAQSDALYERRSTPEGKWYFTLRSPEGVTIAVSQMHTSSAELEHAIALVKNSV